MDHSVALVDDHHLMRNGLVSIVNGLGGFRVTLEAGHGRELIEVLEAHLKAGGEAPAIAIVDLNMPVMDGYATIAWLRAHAPTILPLALTFDAAEDALLRAVRMGARGFLLKSARPAVLKDALDSLMLTGYYYTESTHAALQRPPDALPRGQREREEVHARVTPRELEFLQMVCSDEEYTYDQIAELMGLHRRSVDNHRMSLFDKFNIKSKTGLVLFAMRWGLVK
jgi:DNA-binding NarL/FixJ family response regulator